MSKEEQLLKDLNFKEPTSQEPDGPEWKVSRIKIKTKDLERILSTIKSVRKVLEKVKGLLNSLRQFAKILTLIEQLITDPIRRIIIQVTKTLEKAIDSIGSSGFYFLNTLDYTRVNVPIQEFKNTAKARGSTSDLVGASTKSIFSFLEDISNGKGTTNDTTVDKANSVGINVAQIKELSIATGAEDQLFVPGIQIGTTTYTFGNQRPITYNEWIYCIAEAFIDPLDIPPNTFRGDYKRTTGVDKEVLERRKKTDPFAVLYTDNIDLTKKESYSLSKVGLIKTGKPTIERGTQVDIIIIGIAVPDIVALVSNARILWRMFKALIPKDLTKEAEVPRELTKAEKKVEKDNEVIKTKLYENILSAKETVGRTGQAVNQAGQVVKNAIQSPIETFNSFASAASLLKPAGSRMLPGALRRWEEQYRSATNLVPGGAEPDFYGINVRALFPDLFETLERLLWEVRELVAPQITMGDLIQDAIDALEKRIRTIEIIMNQIETFIEDVLALLTLNISVLKISTTEGDQDVFDQIVNSKGFPTKDSNRVAYHMGFVFCSVIPGPNTSSFQDTGNIDLKKYWEDSQKQYDTNLKQEVTNLNNGIKDLQKILGI